MQGLNIQHENTLIYYKNSIKLTGRPKDLDRYKNPDNDPNGAWISDNPSARTGYIYTVTNPYTGKVDFPPENRHWAFSESRFNEFLASGKVKFKHEHKENERGFIYKRYVNELRDLNGQIDSLFGIENQYMNQNATKKLLDLFQFKAFDYSKPTDFVRELLYSITNDHDIVLDFFSGSGTTAEAVLKNHSLDQKKSNFILVQLEENIDEKTNKVAHDFCIENNLEPIIPSIAQERIKRAAAKIKEETNADIDYGFRVFKLSDSTLNDNYYTPSDMSQDNLNLLENKFKEDVSQYDILTHIILDLGLKLDVSIKDLGNGNFIVEKDLLYVSLCDTFSDDIFNEIKDISPDKLVLSESSFSSDAELTNIIERFKNELASTNVSVL